MSGLRHFRGRRSRSERLFDLLRGLQKPRNQALVTLAGGGAAYYYYSHLDYAPYTNRRRIIDMSRSQEHQLGKEQFQMMKDQFRGQTEDPRSRNSRRVEAIGKKIASVSGQDDFDWEFVVFVKDEPNAFCLPGGKIGVFTGLFDLAKSDDELAAVLAHEYAIGITLPVSLFFELPKSRACELEADYIGLKLMAEACFDPRGSPSVFTKLGEWAKQQPMRVPEYLSTHPADEKRVASIQKILPEIQQGFDESCRESRAFGRAFNSSTSGYRLF